MSIPVIPCDYVSARLVGSRVTCSPPPRDTDQDVLVLIDGTDQGYIKAYDGFRKAGWSLDGSEIVVPEFAQSPHERFNSFSKGEINCIITDSETFFKRFMAATAIATRLNLLDKSDRIALFQAVLYANGGEQ